MSVSIPDEDVEFLDAYAQRHGVGSRSAALQAAVRLLRAAELSDDYVAAWEEWEADNGEAWDGTLADGVQ